MSEPTKEQLRLVEDLAALKELSPLHWARAEGAALRALLREREDPCNGSCDIALARRQVGLDGVVPGNARECAELWEAEAARLKRELLRAASAIGMGMGLQGDGLSAIQASALREQLAEAQREIEILRGTVMIGEARVRHRVAELETQLGHITAGYHRRKDELDEQYRRIQDLEAQLQAERGRRSNAELDCERAFSLEDVFRFKLAAETEARKRAEATLAEHLSAHRTADAHDCAEMEESLQREKAHAEAAEEQLKRLAAQIRGIVEVQLSNRGANLRRISEKVLALLADQTEETT